MVEGKANFEVSNHIDQLKMPTELSKSEADNILEKRLALMDSSSEQSDSNRNTKENPSSLDPNGKYHLDGHIYETDDNGKIYEKDRELLPNLTYTLNGNTYVTDEKGRTTNCEYTPRRTPENQRDQNAQTDVGGEDRKNSDHGGHIVGRDLGGDKGIGNLIAMDYRLNQSDYRRMEGYVKTALDERANVQAKAKIIFLSDSKRADSIISTVTIDGKVTVYMFDNNLDNSLLGKLGETCSESDMANIKSTIAEIDGKISSIKQERDSNGNLEKTRVTITYSDENGENHRIYASISHDGGATQ